MIANRARVTLKFSHPIDWSQSVFRPNGWTSVRPCSSSSHPAGPAAGTITDKNSIKNGPKEMGVSVEYLRGLPQLTVPLPSRKELCLFSLRPVTHSVGDLMEQIRSEDRGIDRVVLKTIDGTRIAASNTIESLMEQDFDLVINDVSYRVTTPERERVSREEMERLSDVQNLVMQLYEALHVGEHQLKKERHLMAQLEQLQSQLLPLEQKKNLVMAGAERRTTTFTWVGLALMGVQFGALARLTWWEYSWDIMEPITYFVTYGTSMACFAYYVLTKQEYILPEVRDREYLLQFHKRAKKVGMNVAEYNRLQESLAQVENDLKRLRDPLRVHHPPAGAKLFDPSAAAMGSSSDLVSTSLWNRTQLRLQNLLRTSKQP
ncbi:calcium uniporter protein, mitochondrial-like isoform X2 [Daphnia pulicaria]|uniref:calcium uniporter protein, mitochondrial-like isoform X2 n=1 Tax=Daphnia pulicaria TaxID=35523 RepID=UPI001EEAED20|nr:calcium uniporter protein, mitochondrial-like isoform X2 [Daphnia pulicaria]